MRRYSRPLMTKAKLPSEVRMISLALLVINIPSVILGIMYYWLILPIPGLILYGLLIAVALGILSVNVAGMTTIFLVIHHFVLLILLLGYGVFAESPYYMAYYFLIIPITSVGFGILMFKTILEIPNTESDA
ncbi:MAG: hypothetical protein AAF927_34070 [Bacteroidota bacterium]